jgi:hypothetical protein
MITRFVAQDACQSFVGNNVGLEPRITVYALVFFAGAQGSLCSLAVDASGYFVQTRHRRLDEDNKADPNTPTASRQQDSHLFTALTIPITILNHCLTEAQFRAPSTAVEVHAQYDFQVRSTRVYCAREPLSYPAWNRRTDAWN